jgi:hypothetical protein
MFLIGGVVGEPWFPTKKKLRNFKKKSKKHIPQAESLKDVIKNEYVISDAEYDGRCVA